jgi:hypothetical protein
MTIATDFEIQNNGDIRYIGAAHGASGAGYYTVLEFHRWLQSLAAEEIANGDDIMDITRDTPSDKSFDTIITLINGYNIDDSTAEHLYGGSIIQNSGNEIYDGIQVIANAGCHVEIVQNGSIIANDFWNSIPFGQTEKGLNPDIANGISHRFMVKVRNSGVDIDSRKLLFQTREWGKTFSEFKINGTGRGVNVVPLTYSDDLNNTTAIGTVAGWTTITNLIQGYNAIDVNNDSVLEYYYSKWDKDTYSINQFYEYMKYITRRGTSNTIYGLNGELFRGITHEITVDTPTGTFDQVELVSWTGGTGQMLAINSPTSPTKIWIQLLTGVPPTDNQTITGVNSNATCLVNVSVLERNLSFPFCGVSTGTALIGSYGFGVNASQLSNNDKLFDLTNTLNQAPNYVTFTVNGLISGEDTVLVTPNDGGTIDFNQFTLNGALNGPAVTSVVVNESIPIDTPATGTIRILRTSGVYTKHAYSAVNPVTKTFTIAATDFSVVGAANGANTYLSYIDKIATATSESFTAVYSGVDRSLYIRVRNGGTSPIKTFESIAILGVAGGSTTAVRTSDA